METLSKVFEDKYNKNVKDCTNEEIYHGLLSWTKEQLKGRGYQDGKKEKFIIFPQSSLSVSFFPTT